MQFHLDSPCPEVVATPSTAPEASFYDMNVYKTYTAEPLGVKNLKGYIYEG
jgi:hypothetical protein